MDKIIRKVEEVLVAEGIARFHYLRGDAVYTRGVDFAKLVATVHFSATDDFPSILDRSLQTEKNQAHVNATDSLYALWNALHLIANRSGLGVRNLRGELKIRPGNRPLMPDRDYTLEAILKFSRNVEIEGVSYQKGEFEGQFYGGGRRFSKIYGEWISKPLNS